MSSAKLRQATTPENEGAHVDMSPMIDMVFLLLIFFMVASVLITNRKDKEVQIPLARNAKVPKQSSGRIVINVLEDGTFRDEMSNELTESEITEHVTEMVKKFKEADVKPRILLRGDSRAVVEHMKRAVKAASAAGVNDVIFATYATRKR